MKKIRSYILLAAAFAFTNNTFAASTYEFVGSWHVGDGPQWSATDPLTPVYSGQEAAAFLFGGNPSVTSATFL